MEESMSVWVFRIMRTRSDKGTVIIAEGKARTGATRKMQLQVFQPCFTERKHEGGAHCAFMPCVCHSRDNASFCVLTDTEWQWLSRNHNKTDNTHFFLIAPLIFSFTPFSPLSPLHPPTVPFHYCFSFLLPLTLPF